MSTKQNLNHLVALMCHVLENSRDGSPRRLDPSLHDFKHGIVENNETNIRTFPILDAIANIAVSRERSQVVAVALQVDHHNEAICLSIAENQSVTADLPNHLENVWEYIRMLSDEYAEQRGGEPDEDELQSPDIPLGVALGMKIDIFRIIYEYSLAKQMKRITKWLHSLGHFMKAFVDHRRYHNLNGFGLNLFDGVLALLTALNLVSGLHDDPPNHLTEAEWTRVYTQSMRANEKIRDVLADGNETSCEALVEELRGKSLLLRRLKRSPLAHARSLCRVPIGRALEMANCKRFYCTVYLLFWTLH